MSDDPFANLKKSPPGPGPFEILETVDCPLELPESRILHQPCLPRGDHVDWVKSMEIARGSRELGIYTGEKHPLTFKLLTREHVRTLSEEKP